MGDIQVKNLGRRGGENGSRGKGIVSPKGSDASLRAATLKERKPRN